MAGSQRPVSTASGITEVHQGECLLFADFDTQAPPGVWPCSPPVRSASRSFKSVKNAREAAAAPMVEVDVTPPAVVATATPPAASTPPAALVTPPMPATPAGTVAPSSSSMPGSSALRRFFSRFF
ncbi:uncharacterized protein CDV56_104778 [Aspergillus thermomutatus]|uniref:Uncharacterized protein n=1 Tax=Aspergillus thermomutatus TaxID=41047 RepID=A0A397HJT9_ASPTH|nr:uncharacterized protein CDV56_104778 [Aspergillus thermomutatus]RHZ60690.1 hypothetical protein CDV56_104778 [Aspergillus thermomutatus]